MVERESTNWYSFEEISTDTLYCVWNNWWGELMDWLSNAMVKELGKDIAEDRGIECEGGWIDKLVNFDEFDELFVTIYGKIVYLSSFHNLMHKWIGNWV